MAATYLYDISSLHLDPNTYSSTSINSIDLSNVAWISNTMNGSFSDCHALTAVTNINTNVVYMVNTYINCTNLVDSPIVPANVTNMYGTFYNCVNLVNAPVIPASISNLDYTFTNCFKLENAPTIPASITKLTGTFQNCQTIANTPTIPSSVTSLVRTFQFCSNLANIATIPESVVNMYSTFSYCTKVVDAPTIPNSVTNMAHTFYGCTNLVNTNSISTGVTSLYETFSNCTNLTHVGEIPNSVINIVQAFNGCTNLTEDIHILSDQITNAYNCFSYTSAAKNIYIPFYNLYTNRENCVTRNSFTTAGYDENGTLHGVYLKSLTPVLSITTVPSTATVTLQTNNQTFITKDLAIPIGDSITWKVEKAGYNTQTDTISALNVDRNLNIILVETTVVFTVIPTPANALVTLEADGYATVSGIGTQSITVLPGTDVTYTVELEGYESAIDDVIITEDTTLEIELNEETADWDFILDENNQATLIEYKGNITEITVPDEVYSETVIPTNNAGSVIDEVTQTSNAGLVTEEIEETNDAGEIGEE